MIKEIRKDDFKVLFNDLTVYYSLKNLTNNKMIKSLKSKFLLDYFKSILNFNIDDNNKFINFNQLIQKKKKKRKNQIKKNYYTPISIIMLVLCLVLILINYV